MRKQSLSAEPFKRGQQNGSNDFDDQRDHVTVEEFGHTQPVRPFGEWVVQLLGQSLPPVGLGIAIWLSWGRLVSSLDILLWLLLYFTTGVGVTAGYHRLFTHVSYRTTRPIRVGLAILGCMTAEEPFFAWVANHRRHHQYSDRVGDPHSPHLHGTGALNALKGIWHAHVGWLFARRDANLSRYIPDLQRDKALVFVNRFHLLWVAMSLVVPAIVAGITLTNGSELCMDSYGAA
jgi:fatty-acid desaturase